jgi:hypothetical protein
MRLSLVGLVVLIALRSIAEPAALEAQRTPSGAASDSARQALEQRLRRLAQPDTSREGRARTRAAALNAMFSFREDVRDGVTKIAECMVEEAVRDTAALKAIDARFRALFARAPSDGCGVGAFMRDTARVLYIESVTDVTRSGSHEAAARPHSIEITVQLLHGPGYREFAEYLLRPSGEAWRVIRYELTGMNFIHEHSQSFVRP